MFSEYEPHNDELAQRIVVASFLGLFCGVAVFHLTKNVTDKAAYQRGIECFRNFLKEQQNTQTQKNQGNQNAEKQTASSFVLVEHSHTLRGIGIDTAKPLVKSFGKFFNGFGVKYFADWVLRLLLMLVLVLLLLHLLKTF